VPTLVAIVAILQGAWTALAAVSGEPGTNLYGLLDATVSIGFGVAAFRRRLWGVYGLVVLATLGDVAQLVLRGEKAWFVPIAVYLIGAVSLLRSEHIAPKSDDLNLRVVVISALLIFFGTELIWFILPLYLGLIGLQHSDFDTALLVVTGLWQVWVFGRAGAGTPWSFETSLCVAVAVIPLNLIDSLLVRGANPVEHYVFRMTILHASRLAAYAVVGSGIQSFVRVPTFSGTFSALRSGLWPSTREPQGARVARLEGVLGALTVAVVTAYLSVSNGEYANLTDSLVSIVCALGISFSWRSAIVVAAADYWISQVLSFASGPPGNPVAHGSSTLILSFLFVNGLRGVFAEHRLSRKAERGSGHTSLDLEAETPASDTADTN
jgi:hypothetical protein